MKNILFSFFGIKKPSPANVEATFGDDNIGDDNIGDDIVDTNAYTKEFTYLPSYSKMEIRYIAPPDNIQMVNAKYLIKNTTTDRVLTEYTETLTKDGWTVRTLSQDNKPFCLNAQKDPHIATLLPEQNINDVILTVVSK